MRKFVKCLFTLWISFLSYIKSVILRFRGVIIGKGFYLRGKLIVKNRGSIHIGNNVSINSSKNANPMSGFVNTSFLVGEGANVCIGNNVGISASAFSAYESILIEDNVLIGSGCCIFDNDFHPINYEARIRDDKSQIEIKPVRICEGAFIGTRTIIAKGVTIGKHSVIGAGSVVLKDVPEKQVWGGNPARFIRNL